jgi:hypothetical protein
MRFAVLGLLLVDCSPVLLGEEPARDAGVRHSDASPPQQPPLDAGRLLDAAAISGEPPPMLRVSVRPVDCGACFELQAMAVGGQPPYVFEWADGSPAVQRKVCVDAEDLVLSVSVRDAAGARSTPQMIRLEALADASCPSSMPPSAAEPPLLCIQNPSFEGTPVVNVGQTGGFDGAPWSDCVNAAMASATPNLPNIGNKSAAPASTSLVPDPTNGQTFLALTEGGQVSQMLCSALDRDATFSLELDLTRIDVGDGEVAESEAAFLELWGGLSVDCSQRELLWASPVAAVGWHHYCLSFHPQSYMDQLTLRANTDMSQASLAFLAIDNLKPVDACP